MPRSAEWLAGCCLLMLWLPVWAVAAPRVAVVAFDARQTSGKLSGEQLADYVTDELVKLRLFTVIERDKLKAIREEIDFSASGLVAGQQAARMGKLLGATHLLSGRVISMETATSTLKSSYGISGKNTSWTLSVAIRIYETETGAVVYSDRARAKWVARDTPQYQSSTDAPFDRLAEAGAVAVVAGIRQSDLAAGTSELAAARVMVPISSVPPGADIEVDGIFVGNTDGSFELATGVHLIRISRAGGPVWEKKVNIDRGLKIRAIIE